MDHSFQSGMILLERRNKSLGSVGCVELWSEGVGKQERKVRSGTRRNRKCEQRAAITAGSLSYTDTSWCLIEKHGKEEGSISSPGN